MLVCKRASCRRTQNCQPNFRKHVVPDSSQTCGPYQLEKGRTPSEGKSIDNAWVCENNHDTISMVAIDKNGHTAAASSSNGANHKVVSAIPCQLSLHRVEISVFVSVIQKIHCSLHDKTLAIATRILWRDFLKRSCVLFST